MRRVGGEGQRLWRLANGVDDRQVSPDRETKSVSNETTFDEDVSDPQKLTRVLLALSEKVSERAEGAGHRRRDRHAETQDRGLQAAHARAHARRADAALGPHFRRRARAARKGSRRHALPAHRRRRVEPARRRQRRPRRSRRSRHRARKGDGERHRRAARASSAATQSCAACCSIRSAENRRAAYFAQGVTGSISSFVISPLSWKSP